MKEEQIREELGKIRAQSAKEISAYTDFMRGVLSEHTSEEMTRYSQIATSIENISREIDGLKKNDATVLVKLDELSEDLKPFVHAKSSFIFFGSMLKWMLWTIITIAGIWAGIVSFIKFIIKN